MRRWAIGLRGLSLGFYEFSSGLWCHSLHSLLHILYNCFLQTKQGLESKYCGCGPNISHRQYSGLSQMTAWGSTRCLQLRQCA